MKNIKIILLTLTLSIAFIWLWINQSNDIMLMKHWIEMLLLEAGIQGLLDLIKSQHYLFNPKLFLNTLLISLLFLIGFSLAYHANDVMVMRNWLIIFLMEGFIQEVLCLFKLKRNGIS